MKTLLNRRILSFVGPGILGGTLQGLCWPHASILPLNFVFFAVFFLALKRARHWKEVVALALTQSVFGCIIGFYWLADLAVNFGGFPVWLSPIVTFLYSLVGQGQLVLFGLICYWLWTKRNAKLPLLFYPALYTAIDCMYPKIFCDTQGAVLYPWFEFVQIAEHVGVYGVTFFIILCNAVLAQLVEPFVFGRKHLFSKSAKQVAPYVALVAMIAVGGHFWGKKRIVELEQIQDSWPLSFTASVMQANIGDADKLASEQGSWQALRFVLGTYAEMTREAVATIKPDLIVWPETAYPYLYTHFQDQRANERGEARDQWVYDLMREIKTPLLFGGYSSDGTRDYNTAFLLRSAEQMVGMYRKSRLLAFGETVPLGPFGPFVRQAIPAMGNFGKGPGPTVFDFALTPKAEGAPPQKLRLGPLICYESIIPSYPLETARKGAQVFLNITNDSWFGNTSEPVSHLILTAFRSIELRRPLLRGTNTGITTLFDITGRMKEPTAVFTKSIYTAEVRYPERSEDFPTGLYYRFGAWFEWLCIVASGLVALWWAGCARWLKKVR